MDPWVKREQDKVYDSKNPLTTPRPEVKDAAKILAACNWFVSEGEGYKECVCGFETRISKVWQAHIEDRNNLLWLWCNHGIQSPTRPSLASVLAAHLDP